MRKKHLMEIIYDLPITVEQRDDLLKRIEEDKDSHMFRGIGIAFGIFSLLMFAIKFIFDFEL